MLRNMCQLWQTLLVAFQLFLLLSLYTWLLIPPGSHLAKKGIRGSWTHLFSCSVLINLSPLRWSYSMSTECSSCQGEMQVSFLGGTSRKRYSGTVSWGVCVLPGIATTVLRTTRGASLKTIWYSRDGRTERWEEIQAFDHRIN